MATDHPFTPDLTQHHLAMLDELAEHGMSVARLVTAQAKAAAAAPAGRRSSVIELGALFTRISHAIRQTLYLRSRLARYLATPRHAAPPAALAAAHSEPSEVLPAEILPPDTGSAAAPERLRQAPAERPERREHADFTEFRHQSFAEIVAGICRDIGISPHSQAWPGSLLASTTASSPSPQAPPFPFKPTPPGPRPPRTRKTQLPPATPPPPD